MTKEVFGYTNRTRDGKYIVFLDYDRVSFDWIVDECKVLQEMFGLRTFYFFQSSKDGFHAVCFDKVKLKTLLLILSNSSVDPRYHQVPLHWGKKIWTLRLTEKNDKNIKPKGFLEKRYNEFEGETLDFREQSSPHIKLINNYFNLKIRAVNTDNLTDVVIAKYKI